MSVSSPHLAINILIRQFLRRRYELWAKTAHVSKGTRCEGYSDIIIIYIDVVYGCTYYYLLQYCQTGNSCLCIFFPSLRSRRCYGEY